MKKLILKIAVIAAALWVTIWLIDGLTFTGSWVQFVFIALIFGVVNTVIRPVAKIVSLPFIILTLGLGALVINALTFWLVAWLSGPDVLDLGFASSGFWASFFGAIVMALASFVLNRFLKPSRR
ncbi:MAG: phage holin family protein [Acidimicrobiia bacterium]|nr:phage holin family protein [Acidimicrobiia bacterium]